MSDKEIKLIDGLTQEEHDDRAAEREAMLGKGKFPRGHQYEGLTLEEARSQNQEREEAELAKLAKAAAKPLATKAVPEKKAAVDAKSKS